MRIFHQIILASFISLLTVASFCRSKALITMNCFPITTRRPWRNSRASHRHRCRARFRHCRHVVFCLIKKSFIQRLITWRAHTRWWESRSHRLVNEKCQVGGFLLPLFAVVRHNNNFSSSFLFSRTWWCQNVDQTFTWCALLIELNTFFFACPPSQEIIKRNYIHPKRGENRRSKLKINPKKVKKSARGFFWRRDRCARCEMGRENIKGGKLARDNLIN